MTGVATLRISMPFGARHRQNGIHAWLRPCGRHLYQHRTAIMRTGNRTTALENRTKILKKHIEASETSIT